MFLIDCVSSFLKSQLPIWRCVTFEQEKPIVAANLHQIGYGLIGAAGNSEMEKRADTADISVLFFLWMC